MYVCVPHLLFFFFGLSNGGDAPWTHDIPNMFFKFAKVWNKGTYRFKFDFFFFCINVTRFYAILQLQVALWRIAGDIYLVWHPHYKSVSLSSQVKMESTSLTTINGTWVFISAEGLQAVTSIQ